MPRKAPPAAAPAAPAAATQPSSTPSTPTHPQCYDTVKNLAIEATCSTGGGAQSLGGQVAAQALVEASGARKVLVINKAHTPQSVTLAGATGGVWTYIDESTALGPAQAVTLAADTWMLAPFALGIVRLAA